MSGHATVATITTATTPIPLDHPDHHTHEPLSPHSGSFVGFFGSLVVIGFSYAFYAASSTCHLNIFFITWTLIMGIVMIGVLAVKNKVRQSLQASIREGLTAQLDLDLNMYF